MNKNELKKLLEKYLNDECTLEERALVESWYNHSEGNLSADNTDQELEQELTEIYFNLPKEQTSNKRIAWLGYAAVVFVLVTAGLAYALLLPRISPNEHHLVAQEMIQDLSPGGNRATLTLSTGAQVFLDEVSTGAIANELGSAIFKDDQNQVVYMNQGKQEISSNQAAPFNTIATPRGGQYKVVLPDGTKVWLNAASSLRFPVRFDGPVRQVEMTGEGYFEVAKNADIPFMVITSKQVVEVFGTHFNLNSYEDEPVVKTTLLEGSVKVVEKQNNRSVLLKPGEQSILNANQQLSRSATQSIDAIAWKNGLFHFQDADLGTVMRQFSRWYDVEIEYDGEVPKLNLFGEVYRNVNASQALEILTYFNLDYRIEQDNHVKKIIIFNTKSKKNMEKTN